MYLQHCCINIFSYLYNTISSYWGHCQRRVQEHKHFITFIKGIMQKSVVAVSDSVNISAVELYSEEWYYILNRSPPPMQRHAL